MTTAAPLRHTGEELEGDFGWGYPPAEPGGAARTPIDFQVRRLDPIVREEMGRFDEIGGLFPGLPSPAVVWLLGGTKSPRRITSKAAARWVLAQVAAPAAALIDRMVTEPAVDAAADLGQPPRDAYDAVAWASSALNGPVAGIQEAAKVAPRTYYSWRAKDVRTPRQASQGRLWRLIDTIQDLRVMLGDPAVRTWVAGDDARRRALAEGRFDDLLALAAADVARRGGYRDTGRHRAALDDLARAGAEDDDRPAPAADKVPATVEVRRAHKVGGSGHSGWPPGGERT